MTPLIFFWLKKRQNKGQDWLTFTDTRGEQLSQAAGGCGRMDERGARLSHSGAGWPQPSCLLLVLPSDPCNSHLLRDWEAVGHSDRRQRHVDQVRHGGRVTERVAGSLGVCFSCLMVARSLVHRALGPRGGGSVSDDCGGHADRCAVTKLVARQWVQERDAWGGQLPGAGGVCCRNRGIRVWLMSIWHGVWCNARCLVFTASRARPGLVRPGIRWGGLRQTVRRQIGLEKTKGMVNFTDRIKVLLVANWRFLHLTSRRRCLQEQHLSQLGVDM